MIGKWLALVVALALGVLGALPAAESQPSERVYQVGYLSLGAPPPRPGILDVMIDALRERNYVEGRNLVVRRAFAHNSPERLQGLVADLVQAKVDVIVTTSTRETQAAKSATSAIPIVMTLAPDPVEQGLVVSLARPGGNVTGLTSMSPGVYQKYVELLREAVPSASRFTVVGGPRSPFPEIRRELQAAARHFGISLSFTEIKAPDHLDPALARAKTDGASGIIVALDRVTYAHRARLVQLALKYRLPGIYWVRDYVEDGGLMAYGASFADIGRRAAYFVDRILKGTKPADLPVEQPMKFDLVINLKTAKALGLTIPQSLLIRADQLVD